MVKGEYQVSKTYSKFRQQKLKAWQPILTAGSVLPTFFLIGVVFVPVGVVLLVASDSVSNQHLINYYPMRRRLPVSCFHIPIDDRQLFHISYPLFLVKEFELDYTDCTMGQNSCKDVIANFSRPEGTSCRCVLNFELTDNVESPVYLYYGLSGFYQNHRRYVKSRDDIQLLGDPKHVSSDCAPFQYVDKLPIAPCGAIANSLFNDTFLLNYKNTSGMQAVPITFKGIAWPSDLEHKFRNPSTKPLKKAFEGTVSPPNWPKPVDELSFVEEESGFQNESLIVWMRSAALPNFRKLHSRVVHGTGGFADKLPKGNYTVEIVYNYPVAGFGGRKRFIISNASWAGGKNPFLGIAYIVVGSLCIFMGLVFLVIHVKFGQS
ncbi:CDC50 domain containing protein [Trichuris trichiura]|uniref:CDC50 domain containing protein n=1 Tax=Trichuris trichiura TaxID=36087 RepID=A0A077ZB75_TRITR|nr:CDC50 domain containing protein [Trichuris trichiura]